jgi:hypothetical protein
LVTSCTFEDNAGAGVYTVNSDCTVRASRFYENVAPAGGGIFALRSNTRVEDRAREKISVATDVGQPILLV